MLLFLAGARLKVMEIMQKNEVYDTSISLSYDYVQKIISIMEILSKGKLYLMKLHARFVREDIVFIVNCWELK